MERLHYFDRNGFEQLINEVGKDHLSLAQRSRDIYAVVVDDKVISIGYRDDRLKPKNRLSAWLQPRRHRFSPLLSENAALPAA